MRATSSEGLGYNRAHVYRARLGSVACPYGVDRFNQIV